MTMVIKPTLNYSVRMALHTIQWLINFSSASQHSCTYYVHGISFYDLI